MKLSITAYFAILLKGKWEVYSRKYPCISKKWEKNSCYI